MKIAFCSSETVPFIKTGGLADVGGALPVELEKLGEEVVLFLPHYRSVDLKGFALERVNPQTLATKIGKNIRVFLIENAGYFGRDGIYGDRHGDFPDNLQRFDFFCRQSLALLRELNLKVDVIHGHDWQTGLIPVYLKKYLAGDSFFKETKCIFTIHNMAYQGIFSREQFRALKWDERLFSPEGLEHHGRLNLLKGGLVFSDRLTTVSPQYARDIQSDPLACGLEGVLRTRQDSVVGILNGLDQTLWDPATDPLIWHKYSAQDPALKDQNKAKLQSASSLSVDPRVPVFGFVGRLSYQKGLDLLAQAFDQLAQFDLQMVFLGVGEEKYHQFFLKMQSRYPQKVAVHLQFDEERAHQIYAGSDFFLMPSVYEPCGLSQMISLRYGTLPLVFETGGLADTVFAYDDPQGRGNGFVFSQYRPQELLRTVQQAIHVFQQPELFQELRRKVMTLDFSWERSAKEYQKLYRLCLPSV